MCFDFIMAEEIIKIHDARVHNIGSEEGREKLLIDVRETVAKIKSLYPSIAQKKEIYVYCRLKLGNDLATSSSGICAAYCKGNPYISSRDSDYWIQGDVKSYAEIWMEVDKQELDTFQKKVEVDLMELVQIYEERDFDGLVRRVVLSSGRFELEETLKALQGNKKVYLEVRAERLTIAQKKEENKKEFSDLF